MLTGRRKVILGSWKVAPRREWQPNPDRDKHSSSYRHRVRIPVVDPQLDDFNEVKGKILKGRLGQGVFYFSDLSP